MSTNQLAPVDASAVVSAVAPSLDVRPSLVDALDALPKPGTLRVWWVPQVPCKAFRFGVESPAEGKRVLHILAEYDLFQLANNIKPDFCNAGGLECFSQDGDGEWCDWHDPDTGDGIDDWEPAS